MHDGGTRSQPELGFHGRRFAAGTERIEVHARGNDPDTRRCAASMASGQRARPGSADHGDRIGAG